MSKKTQYAIENYLEKYAAQQAWFQLAVNTFNDFGDCQLVYFALLKVVELE